MIGVNLLIDLSKEKLDLQQAYNECYDIVKNDDFFTLFAKEKIKHSYQVLGAGNYILKHEPIFQNKSQEYLKLAKATCLLHDIGRFKEIERLYRDNNSKHDHSIYSYEKLKQIGYKDERLLLSVKQHGHLKEALDNDIEFQEINDKNIKKETRELYQLVKDADKIANLYLIKTDKRIFKDLFAKSHFKEEMDMHISPNVLKSLENNKLVDSKDVVTFMDRFIQILCQFYEIYYETSFKFIKFHKLAEEMFAITDKYNPDKNMQQYVENKIRNYLEQH